MYSFAKTLISHLVSCFSHNNTPALSLLSWDEALLTTIYLTSDLWVPDGDITYTAPTADVHIYTHTNIDIHTNTNADLIKK